MKFSTAAAMEAAADLPIIARYKTFSGFEGLRQLKGESVRHLYGPDNDEECDDPEMHPAGYDCDGSYGPDYYEIVNNLGHSRDDYGRFS